MNFIGKFAFSNCYNLGAVTIQEGTSSIGESAFSFCYNLSSITIPSSVKTVESDAFQSCYKLSTAVISDGVVSLGESAFVNCNMLSSVTLSSTLTAISKNTFYGCSELTSVTIPSSVISIGSNAFSYCKKLSSVTIPESVTSIGEAAFSYSAITAVTIPASVKTIEKETFSHCQYLSSVVFPEGLTAIGESAFFYCTSLGSVILPSSLISIGESAFRMCEKITAMAIPEGVTTIGGSAFTYCRSLSSLTIPSSVTSIENNAFSYNNALVSITAGFSVPLDLTFSNEVFYGINKATCKLYVPYDTKSMYAAAFQWKDFTNIIESPVVFKLSTNSVSLSAEDGSQVSVEITANIAWTAAYNQSWLTVNPPSGKDNDMLVITAAANPSNAFRTGQITISINGIPSQTISVLQEAKGIAITVTPGSLSSLLTDDQKNTITKLILSGSMDARDFKTMRDQMPNLEIIDLRDVQIEAYTGEGGTEWNTVAYPKNEIPIYAFFDRVYYKGKARLASFICPSSATSVGHSAFFGCNALTSVVLAPSIISIGNDAFTDCWKLNAVILPDGLQTIGAAAFKYCRSLGAVTIPGSLQSMGNNAFSGCSNLTTLVFSEGASAVGEYAFYQCTNLTAVTFPSSVPSIPTGAFIGCEKLSSVIISPGVVSIGQSAFQSCYGLSSVSIPSSIRTIGDNAFGDCEQLGSITLPEGLTSLGKSAFYGCKSMTSVTVPSTLGVIENMVFTSCTSLSSVIISNGVTSIGDYAFQYCTSLTLVSIPPSVTSIGEFAFKSSSLQSIYATRSVPVDLQFSSNVFMDVNKTTCKLYVPYGSKELYAAADQWKDFINIVEVEGSLVNPSIIVDKGAPDRVIDLKTVFNDESLISCTVTSNTNQQVVKATISGSELTLDFSSEYTGNTEILITALSIGKEVKSTFKVEVKLPTGINSLEAHPVLLVYPNPTKGEVHVKLNSIPASGTELSVYNASGKVIYKSLITKKEETIDLQGNAPGVYFIKIGKKANEKIIVL